MANSISYTDVTALQAFVRTFGTQLFSRALLEFETAKHVFIFPGIKGKHVITRMKKNGSLIRGFTPTFSGFASQALEPVEIAINDFKSELQIIPSELRATYLGFLASRGFDPREWPIQRYALDQHMLGMAEEMEIAIWEGVRSGVAAADAPIIQKMDGFGVRVNEAITAGNTPIVTGAITVTNIVEQLRAMYDAVAKPLKGKEVLCYLSINHQQDYFIKRGENLQYTMDQWTNARFNTGNMKLIFVPGLADDKILITTMDNLVYGVDDIGDSNKWFFKQEHYSIEGSVTMAAGTQIIDKADGYLVVNDQW